jgi:SAM-dependent methyltransferase
MALYVTPVPASVSTEFGNLDANLRFLQDTGLVRPSLRALEIGCGGGSLLHKLKTSGLDIIGVETSPERIEESHRAYGPLPIQHISGSSLPFPDECFDMVLSFDVFEHIPDSDAHLAEVRRVLKPGGWYLLQTPNKWTNAIFETIRWRSFSKWKVDHCSLHSHTQLRDRLARHGFDVVFDDVKVVTPFFRQKVRRYLGPAGSFLLTIVNPDRLPLPLRTNFYVRAQKLSPSGGLPRTDQGPGTDQEPGTKDQELVQ